MRTECVTVVIYSHYIPCSSVYNTLYECAVRLTDWLDRQRHEKALRTTNMIVGHVEDWATTNPQRSQWYLFIGGVPLFQLSGRRFVTRQIYTNPSETDTIQKRAYDCLTGMHMRVQETKNLHGSVDTLPAV